MRKAFCSIIVMLLAVTFSHAQPIALPVSAAPTSDAFADAVDLAPLGKISVLHNQVLKTFDSYARQSLTQVSGRGSLDGRGAVFTILDIAFRPEAYAHRNLIHVKNVPLRKDFDKLTHIDGAEKTRILEEGKISLAFWFSPEVQAWAQTIQSTATFKATAIERVQTGAFVLGQIARPFPTFPGASILPPSTTEAPNKPWRNINEIAGNVPWWADVIRRAGVPVPARIDGYDDALLTDLASATNELAHAWTAQDAAVVNAQVIRIADLLPRLNPAVYPSELKRSGEVMYNRLAKMTLPGVVFYFAAFSCFLLAARSGVGTLRLWGLRLFTIAFLIHTVGIIVRWWLVEKSTDDWFHSIPIRNQFESVMMSAWFGAAVGLFLEFRFTRSIFGAAASFVGWLSLLAIFAAPYVTGTEIGGEIGQVAGILMSYWLYIHVTTVVASYALIGMSFLLGIWWLVRYYQSYGTLRKTPARQLSSDASDMDYLSTSVSGGAILARPTVLNTLAQLLWVKKPTDRLVASATQSSTRATDSTKSLLATLDLCHLVVLQLTLVTLGVGVILGAVWADMSWGRPWGWDPKETFSLVTWIIYLVVLHVRLVSENKAWWTAILSIFGFFFMLFNWIGVNFFLVGLHSYA